MKATYIWRHEEPDGYLKREGLFWPGDSFDAETFWEREDDGTVMPVLRVAMDICDDGAPGRDEGFVRPTGPTMVDLPYASMDALLAEWRLA